jgi:hypothetical protein
LILRINDFSLKDNLLIRLPFTVYFGWITVATIANVTTFLVYINWNKFSLSEVFWTILVIILGAIIGFSGILYYRSKAYGVVILWAYTGIAIKHISPSGFNDEYIWVIVSVVISALLLIFGEVLLLKRNFKKKVGM